MTKLRKQNIIAVIFLSLAITLLAGCWGADKNADNNVLSGNADLNGVLENTTDNIPGLDTLIKEQLEQQQAFLTEADKKEDFIRKKNVKGCRSLQSQTLADNCEFEIIVNEAIEKQDSSLCREIQNQDLQTQCLSLAAN